MPSPRARTVAPARGAALETPAGYTLAAAFAACFVVVTLARAVDMHVVVATAIVTLVVALCSVRATWSAAAGAAVLGWLFLDGFVLNRYGELRVSGPQDVWLLVLLAGAALGSAGLSRR